MYALLTPMPGLPWYLLPIWPLIFWRIQRLKSWFRNVGGPGSEMLWGVAWNGRVKIVHLSDDLPGPHPACFRAPVSDRLASALRGDEGFNHVRSPRRKPGPRDARTIPAALDPGFRREEREFGVIPDT